MSPTIMTAAVIHTSLPLGFLVSTKLPFFPFCTNALQRRWTHRNVEYMKKMLLFITVHVLHMYAQANDKEI